MADNFGQQSQQRVSMNRFGESEILKTANAVVDKKTGDILPIYKAYFEIGGQLYKVEVSDRKKETKTGNPAMWVKITKKKKQSQTAQRF